MENLRNKPANLPTAVDCPSCGQSVDIGMPRGAEVIAVRLSPIQETISAGETKTRTVRCRCDHSIHVTFALPGPTSELPTNRRLE